MPGRCRCRCRPDRAPCRGRTETGLVRPSRGCGGRLFGLQSLDLALKHRGRVRACSAKAAPRASPAGEIGAAEQPRRAAQCRRRPRPGARADATLQVGIPHPAPTPARGPGPWRVDRRRPHRALRRSLRHHRRRGLGSSPDPAPTSPPRPPYEVGGRPGPGVMTTGGKRRAGPGWSTKETQDGSHGRGTGPAAPVPILRNILPLSRPRRPTRKEAAVGNTGCTLVHLGRTENTRLVQDRIGPREGGGMGGLHPQPLSRLGGP